MNELENNMPGQADFPEKNLEKKVLTLVNKAPGKSLEKL